VEATTTISTALQHPDGVSHNTGYANYSKVFDQRKCRVRGLSKIMENKIVEEVQSANEEFHGLHEELKTSKGELELKHADEIESKFGTRSTFTVRLPLVMQKAKP
jgi:hypothetical protein